MKTILSVAKTGEGIKGLEDLFWAYFNNKMMMLLLMIEHPFFRRDPVCVAKQKAFLDDLYHHFLPQGSAVRYRRAFQWLQLFLDRYPDFGPARAHRAVEMVERIYEVFGLKLERRLSTERIERETPGLSDKRRKGPEGSAAA